jgi:hypothetical protein
MGKQLFIISIVLQGLWIALQKFTKLKLSHIALVCGLMFLSSLFYWIKKNYQNKPFRNFGKYFMGLLISFGITFLGMIYFSKEVGMVKLAWGASQENKNYYLLITLIFYIFFISPVCNTYLTRFLGKKPKIGMYVFSSIGVAIAWVLAIGLANLIWCVDHDKMELLTDKDQLTSTSTLLKMLKWGTFLPFLSLSFGIPLIVRRNN